MIAGDKQFTHSGGMIMRGKTKIYELPEHTAREIFHSKRLFVGFAGNVDDFAKAIQYFYTLDGKPPKCKNIEMLFSLAFLLFNQFISF